MGRVFGWGKALLGYMLSVESWLCTWCLLVYIFFVLVISSYIGRDLVLVFLLLDWIWGRVGSGSLVLGLRDGLGARGICYTGIYLMSF